MKKLFNVVVLTLAINFLAVAGGVAWLQRQGALTREKLIAVKEVLLPKPPEQAPASTPPDAGPATQPILQLDELLARAAGRPATEQVEFIQHAFDAQMALLDRRARELNDLQRQVELSKQQMARDRAALDAQQQLLDARQEEAARLAADQGFQESLEVYTSLPPKQVKSIFMALDDKTVTNYLKAMEPRMAAKIIKEFKSPEETQRAQQLLEAIRQSQASIEE